MQTYLSAREIAEQWDISQRRVAVLCSENRIDGAQMVGNMWIIPADAVKPIDARTLKAKDEVLPIKPFIKWAGGKSQLLATINNELPNNFGQQNTKYAEPMVGGGALLFNLIKSYEFKEIFISDINKELINVYRVIKSDVENLIKRLVLMQEDYYGLNEEERKLYYYARRNIYNELITSSGKSDSVEKASLFIFLNKTCFNGLYRVNSKNQYNVPMGSYKKPLICDKDNLLNISEILQNVKIEVGDYKKCIDFVDSNTFVYFDPPYRPINKTSGFTSYTEGGFGDTEQKELAEFAKILSNKGAKVMLSNSNPKNTDPYDTFFEDIYRNFNIKQVTASRMINSSGNKRGKITELLIKNY